MQTAPPLDSGMVPHSVDLHSPSILGFSKVIPSSEIVFESVKDFEQQDIQETNFGVSSSKDFNSGVSPSVENGLGDSKVLMPKEAMQFFVPKEATQVLNTMEKINPVLESKVEIRLSTPFVEIFSETCKVNPPLDVDISADLAASSKPCFKSNKVTPPYVDTSSAPPFDPGKRAFTNKGNIILGCILLLTSGLIGIGPLLESYS